MNKESIDEMEQIQKGLEEFLEKEVKGYHDEGESSQGAAIPSKKSMEKNQHIRPKGMSRSRNTRQKSMEKNQHIRPKGMPESRNMRQKSIQKRIDSGIRRR